MAQLGTCGKFLKYSIYIVNLLIFIIGITVVGLGIWALVDGAQFNKIVDQHQYTSSAAILLTFGGIVAFISFLGCCGAIKEIKCFVLTYFIILLLITILIIIGVVFAFKMKDKADDAVVDGLKSTMKRYKEDEAIKNAWDDVQKNFKCCGANLYSDWQNVGTDIPGSCVCKDDDEKKCHAAINGTISYWDNGCWEEIKDEIKKYTKPLAAAGVAIILIIILSMIFSCALFMKL